MSDLKRGLTEAEEELVMKFTEECGEGVQAAMKLLHHGCLGKYDNIGDLVREINDVAIIMNLLTRVFPDQFDENAEYPIPKLDKLQADLHCIENIRLIEQLRKELTRD